MPDEKEQSDSFPQTAFFSLLRLLFRFLVLVLMLVSQVLTRLSFFMFIPVHTSDADALSSAEVPWGFQGGGGGDEKQARELNLSVFLCLSVSTRK